MHAHREISERLLDWADEIFVMEKEHKAAILHLKPEIEKKIIVLDIPNDYLRNDSELVKTLKAKLSKHLIIKW
jgi:predicted protein tyrosine phosphatase